MTSCPIFYFSSKKENPKTHLLIHLKNNQNNKTSAEFKSNLNLDLKIDGQDYLLNLDIKLNCEIDEEPLTDIKYTITKILSAEKIIFNNTVNNLISFMDEFKYNIKEDVDGETKKLVNLEKHKKNKEEQKAKELLKIQEDNKIKEHLEKCKIEDERIEDERKNKDLLKIDEDKKIELQNKIELLWEDKLHLDTMEDIKISNTELSIENLRIEYEEKNQFDEKNIIKYLRDELEQIKNDDDELNKDENIIEHEKLQYFKEKYNIDSDDDIIKTYKVSLSKTSNIDTELQIKDEIYNQIVSIISGNKEMIYTNLIYIITELMKFVENFNLEGLDKKTLIIISIKKFLLNENIGTSEIDVILDTICPELIDILLLVDKRKIIIRRKIRCFIPWCS